jgi:hypothetical protein
MPGEYESGERKSVTAELLSINFFCAESSHKYVNLHCTKKLKQFALLWGISGVFRGVYTFQNPYASLQDFSPNP